MSTVDGGASVAGRVAIVTGAAGGIGAAVARRLVAEGAGVVLADTDEVGCEKLAGELDAAGERGRAVSCTADVTSPRDWSVTIRLARRRFGYPDILVNNAGAVGIHGMQGVTDAEWDQVVAVCQTGTRLGMQSCAPCMQLAGGGSIVNVASVMALVGSGAAFAYHAAKGAVRSMTAAAAVELASQRVRVNAVFPGLVETPMTDVLPEQFIGKFVDDTPMGRKATANEVASAVLFLASDESSYVTGAELVVDGGYTAR